MIRNKIEELLKKQKKSMYWLAETTGVTYPRLFAHVRGRTTMIRYDTLAKICLALNCNVGDVLEFKPKPKKRR